MANKNFTPCVQAFMHVYATVLPFSNVRKAFIEKRLKFGPKKITIVDDPEWMSKRIPKAWQRDTPSRVPTFWGFCEFFCREILENPIYYLKMGGSETSGGFGLYARNDTDNLAINEAIIGLIEPLTEADLQYLESVNFKSFIMVDRVNTCILYGPLCLVNNDNHSNFEFVDREYQTGKSMYKLLPMVGIPDHLIDTPVTTVHRFRVIRVHAFQEGITLADRHILVNYNDPRFMDLSRDSDSGGEETTASDSHQQERDRFPFLAGTSSSSETSPTVPQNNVSSTANTTSDAAVGSKRKAVSISEPLQPTNHRSRDHPVFIQPRPWDPAGGPAAVPAFFRPVVKTQQPARKSSYVRTCPTMPPPTVRRRLSLPTVDSEVKKEEEENLSSPESQVLIRRKPTPIKCADQRVCDEQYTPRSHISAHKQPAVVVPDTYQQDFSSQPRATTSSQQLATPNTTGENITCSTLQCAALAQYPLATVTDLRAREMILRDYPRAVEMGLVRGRAARSGVALLALRDNQSQETTSDEGGGSDSSEDDDSTYNPDEQEEHHHK